MNTLRTLADWLRSSQFTVVLTGAGMSTESGLPDFRSKEGWWRKINPQTVANTDALNHNYDLFREFYRYRIETLQRYKPHEGHTLLAEWERKGLVRAIVTQNVDGFHTAAGSQQVAELHGRLMATRCHDCGKSVLPDAFLANESCAACGGKLRPGVVLFGEPLPEEAWRRTLEWFRAAELVIVIGTSLQVSPANQLPYYTNGKTVYINMETDDALSGFDLAVQGKAKPVLTELNALLFRSNS